MAAFDPIGVLAKVRVAVADVLYRTLLFIKELCVFAAHACAMHACIWFALRILFAAVPMALLLAGLSEEDKATVKRKLVGRLLDFALVLERISQDIEDMHAHLADEPLSDEALVGKARLPTDDPAVLESDKSVSLDTPNKKPKDDGQVSAGDASSSEAPAASTSADSPCHSNLSQHKHTHVIKSECVSALL